VRLTLSIKTDGTSSYPSATGENPLDFEIKDGTTYVNIYFQVYNGTTYNETVTPYLCVEGAVADSANDGADYAIDLGSTYYGGEIDLATGLMTVTHIHSVLTGAETLPWGTSSNTKTTNFYTSGAAWHSLFPKPKNPAAGPVCTHFPFLYSGNSDTVHFYVFSGGGAAFWYPDPDMTVDEWKAYLAAQYANGTPVTLCYEVTVPTTVQLTPTQILSLAQTDKYTPRLNTIYTDAQAVQVGYVKSPIREEYEITQAIVAQGGNI
jgi:hypothetical protein